jgi:putative phosphoesterase
MNPFVIGVVSDTHIPDRAARLPDHLLDGLKSCNVQLILHAGDISTSQVLRTLEEIAPVKAVKGNRDLFIPNLPMFLEFEINGVKIALMHGHINLPTYWADKYQFITRGYQRERYISRLPKASPDARLYIFGHTHHAESFDQNGKYFFNPGSVSIGDYLTNETSWGRIEIGENGSICATIIPL